ncbi:unnamed protein product, partial [Rotaria sordida]
LHQLVQQFVNGSFTGIKRVVIFPTATGKHVNPLDNTFWHAMKVRFPKLAPTTEYQIIHAIHHSYRIASKTDIRNYYHCCA